MATARKSNDREALRDHGRRWVILCSSGSSLLVLPGPGLLLVLAGLLVLPPSSRPVERYIDPVQDRAMQAAEQSVSSPLRLTGSILFGLALIGAGVAWGLLGTACRWAAGRPVRA